MAKSKCTRTAAIGTEAAAEMNGLDVVYDLVGDDTNLQERYALIANNPAFAPQGVNRRCTLVAVPHSDVGSLARLLTNFDSLNLPVVNVVSRPMSAVARHAKFLPWTSSPKHWDYLYFIEFIPVDPESAKLLADVTKHTCKYARIVGNYASLAKTGAFENRDGLHKKKGDAEEGSFDFGAGLF